MTLLTDVKNNIYTSVLKYIDVLTQQKGHLKYFKRVIHVTAITCTCLYLTSCIKIVYPQTLLEQKMSLSYPEISNQKIEHGICHYDNNGIMDSVVWDPIVGIRIKTCVVYQMDLVQNISIQQKVLDRLSIQTSIMNILDNAKPCNRMTFSISA